MEKDNFTKDISLRTFNDIVTRCDFAFLGEPKDDMVNILRDRVDSKESAISEMVKKYKDLIFAIEYDFDISKKEGFDYFTTKTKTFKRQSSNIDKSFIGNGLIAMVDNKEVSLHIDRAVARQRGLSAILDILGKIDVDKLPKTRDEREALFWSKCGENLGGVENAIKYAAIAEDVHLYPCADAYDFGFRKQEDIVKNIQTMKGYALSELNKLNQALDTRNKTELFVESESIKQKICNTKSLEKESLANQIKRNSEKDVNNDEKKTNVKEKEAR